MKIKDIAEILGISKATVSLALNGKPGVSEETRKKVLQVAAEYGYKPKGYKNLTKTKTIKFVACTNTGIVTEQYQYQPFFMELINNVEKLISSMGYSLSFSSITAMDLKNSIHSIIENASGVILLGTNLTIDQIRMFHEMCNNLVVIDTCQNLLNTNFIVMNNELGAYQAGEYLIKLGHKKIGYVESNSRIYNFEMRKKGFFQILKENGLDINKEHIYSMSPTIIGVQENFKQTILKQKNNLPTALFCECDYLAISVIKTLNELNIKIPDDISVIGFDNIKEANIVSPELTTIHIKKDVLANLAVKKLINEIENNDHNKIKILVDTELVIRKSCAPIKNNMSQS